MSSALITSTQAVSTATCAATPPQTFLSATTTQPFHSFISNPPHRRAASSGRTGDARMPNRIHRERMDQPPPSPKRKSNRGHPSYMPLALAVDCLTIMCSGRRTFWGSTCTRIRFSATASHRSGHNAVGRERDGREILCIKSAFDIHSTWRSSFSGSAKSKIKIQTCIHGTLAGR